MEETKPIDRVSLGPDENVSQESAKDLVNPILLDVLNIYVPLLLSLGGIVSNLLNMIVFGKLGFRDSMSINVFALSLSDFLTTFLYAVVCLCYLSDKFYPTSSIDAFVLGYIPIGWMMNAMYMVSCWITAVIAIERCVCVVLPFEVKQIFTRFRSCAVILIIYFVHISLHVPLYVIHKMEWIDKYVKVVGDINVTGRYVRVFSTLFLEETGRIEMIFDIVVSLALTDVSFVIVIICTVWMIRGLKMSSQVRQVSIKSTETTGIHKSKLSSKERKLIKVALALAITLTACGLPRVVTVIVENSIPGAKTETIKSYTIILWAVTSIFTTIGCSITIFVYLILNANYRSTFQRLFQY
ncbi:hypothetical protein BsWGS_12236 [Bradybaena similaris]